MTQLSNLSEILVQQRPTQIEMVDRLFYKAYDYFKICNFIVLIYALLKIIITPFMIYLAYNTSYQIWLTLIQIISISQILHYWRLHKISQNRRIFLQIAEELNHLQIYNVQDINFQAQNNQNLQIQNNYQSINQEEYFRRHVHNIYDFSDPQQIMEDQRKVKFLALQIKYRLQKNNKNLYFFGKIQFIIYQILHFWGFFLIITVVQEETIVGNYTGTILILSTYQYLEFYVLALMIIVIGPFYWGKKFIADIIKRRKAARLIKMLKGNQFKPNNNMITQCECKICMRQYQLDEEIVILKCSQLHHFHSCCIKQWVKVSPTCPMCRKQLTE